MRPAHPRRSRPTLLAPAAAALALALAASPLAAQYLGGGTKTAHEARLADLDEMREKFVSLGGAFPAEAHDWRPMEGVRSVRDVFALIAAEGSLFPLMWGYDVPAWVPDPSIGAELQRLGELDFAELLTEVDRSFGHALELFEAMEPAELERPVTFFGLEVPLGTAVTLMANDMHEHLGQLIAYARTNRVVPPWSRRDGASPGR